jgi:hypothetical protein
MMYRCTSLAKLNKWHTDSKDCGGNVECVPDSKALHLASCATELQSSTMVGDKAVFLNVGPTHSWERERDI